MVKTGLEVFLENIKTYRNRKIALIANQTSITSDYHYSWDILRKEGIGLKRLFSPEHGLFATEQDQDPVKIQPSIGDYEIVSLYGNSYSSLTPSNLYMDDIDLVLFDIQDVGSRYYTYINTMALFMEAVEKRDIEFVVLDRPNPIGGLRVEGPGLQEGYESFVGIIPVPVRHGMTAGELSIFYKDIKRLDLNLTVIKMNGWSREMLYRDTNLPWNPPSPNIPTEFTTYIYPGSCLIEGTNISEGRGTTTPFNIIGASYIDPNEFADYINSFDIPGVYFRPIYFKPTFDKYVGEIIGGVFIHITNLEVLMPFLIGVAIVKAAYDLYVDDFSFLKDRYEFNTNHPAFDLLAGGSLQREMILNKQGIDELSDSWKKDEDEFIELRDEFQLYI